MLTYGSPKARVNFQDVSVLPDIQLSSIIGVQGITMRGKVHKPVLVTSSDKFRQEFGGVHPDDRFPLKCMRLLDQGLKLYVSRVGHYTDIADAETLAGTVATVTLDDAGGNTWVINAVDVGVGYNDTKITISAAASGLANTFDLLVELPDNNVSEELTDIPQTPSAAQITEYNTKLKHIQLGTLTGNVVAVTGTLAGGAQTVADIVATDYNGNSTSKTGWYSFDSVEDIEKLANIAKPLPDIDVALAAYCQSRYDAGYPIRFYIAPPLGATPSGIKDYREGTGSYDHTAIDNWLGSIVAGDVNMTNPYDAKDKFDIPGLVDVLALHVRKEQQGNPWLATAGYQRGQILAPNNGLSTNLGSASYAADYDSLYKAGINAVVNKAGKVIYWGNRTLLADRSKLLSKENQADLAVFIIRNLRPMVEKYMFEPNDIPTWKDIYKEVYPFIKRLADNGAIYRGEGQNWFWLGDQDVNDVSEVQINNVADVNNGIYKARFVYTGISAIEQIAIDVLLTDTQSLSFVVSEAA